MNGRATSFARPSRLALALALATAASTAAQPAWAAAPSVERLDDGAELVVVPIEGATSVSFRYLVHAGGTSDPVGMEGLAHLLEHAMFHGAYRATGREVFERARALGAYLNAFTGPDHTVYVLDGPSRGAWSLLPTYLTMLTSPAFDPLRLEAERGVVSAEAVLRAGRSSYEVMMQLLLPGLRAQTSVIGTERSRERVHRRDLLDFYRAHYRPSNVTLVLAGDVDAERARALVRSASLLAPTEDALPEQPLEPLNIPAEARVPAPFYLTLYGYDLTGEERTTCLALAELMEARLTRAAQIERPLASSVAAGCLAVQGKQLLVTLASSRSYEGGGLLGLLEGELERARTTPLSALERERVLRRSMAHLAQLVRDPAALAEALVMELSARGAGHADRAALAAVMEPLRFDPQALRRAAARCFVPDRRVQIDAGPL